MRHGPQPVTPFFENGSTPEDALRAISYEADVNPQHYIPTFFLTRLLRRYGSLSNIPWEMLDPLYRAVCYTRGDAKAVHGAIWRACIQRLPESTSLLLTTDDIREVSATLFVEVAENASSGKITIDEYEEIMDRAFLPPRQTRLADGVYRPDVLQGLGERGGNNAHGDTFANNDADAHDSDADSSSDSDDDAEDNRQRIRAGSIRPNPCLPPGQTVLTPAPLNGRPTDVRRIVHQSSYEHLRSNDESNGVTNRPQETALASATPPTRRHATQGSHLLHSTNIFVGASERHGNTSLNSWQTRFDARARAFARASTPTHSNDHIDEAQAAAPVRVPYNPDVPARLPITPSQNDADTPSAPTKPASSPTCTAKSQSSKLASAEKQDEGAATEAEAPFIEPAVSVPIVAAPSAGSQSISAAAAGADVGFASLEDNAVLEIEPASAEDPHAAVADDESPTPVAVSTKRSRDRSDDSHGSSSRKIRRRSSFE